ncbi:MAG: hypothetical protein BWY57_02938 [Betaproteobacteria bacterium ADurb.Bin341]|nr:MAG: hypothetical protein BWY57_02938 [Betaproteobacteria bacterium ADurb.Bin341]
MGLNRKYLDFIEGACAANGLNGRPGAMLEMGDQVVRGAGVAEATGKAYFGARGWKHVSVDMNGKHGAVKKDLRRPEEFAEWRGQFDVVTNSGTSEHVEPMEKQWECFKVVHDCLRVGGLAIHILPDVVAHDVEGAWAGHCSIYYSREFFNNLAGWNCYWIVKEAQINGNLCVALRKDLGCEFMPNRDAFLSCLHRRGSGGESAKKYGKFVKYG